MKKVLIASSLMYDYIMDYQGAFADHIIPEKIKALSVTFPLENLSRNFGGNGGNFAYTLSMLGVGSSVMTSVGQKDFGPYETHLKKLGVDTSLINIVQNKHTGQCFIMSDKLHCQITGVYFGPMVQDKNLSLADIKNLNEYDFMLISTSTAESITKFAKEAQEHTVEYLYAPGQEIGRLTGDQLKIGIQGAKILVVNDYELALVSKKTGMTKGDILKTVELLITTLGAEGSLIESEQETITIGTAPSEKKVDPTGAGDAYIAGFIAGYLRDFPLKTCGQMGALAAIYNLEHYGTQKHVFTKESFAERYQSAFGEEISL